MGNILSLLYFLHKNRAKLIILFLPDIAINLVRRKFLHYQNFFFFFARPLLKCNVTLLYHSAYFNDPRGMVIALLILLIHFTALQ